MSAQAISNGSGKLHFFRLREPHCVLSNVALKFLPALREYKCSFDSTNFNLFSPSSGNGAEVGRGFFANFVCEV